MGSNGLAGVHRKLLGGEPSHNQVVARRERPASQAAAGTRSRRTLEGSASGTVGLRTWGVGPIFPSKVGAGPGVVRGGAGVVRKGPGSVREARVH